MSLRDLRLCTLIRTNNHRIFTAKRGYPLLWVPYVLKKIFAKKIRGPLG